MENDLDLVTIGDASLDNFLTPLESDALCQLDNKKSFICFNFGDKIPVSDLEICIGGNAANNSVGSSRLGVKVAIVLTTGDDQTGDRIIKTLENEGVTTHFVVRELSSKSNYSTIISYQGERTIFVYHAPRSYAFPQNLPVTPWVYLTSMGENFQDYYNNLYEFVKKNSISRLAFNPGSWQLRAGVDAIRNVLSLTHVLFVNREEAQKLTGIAPSDKNQKDLLSGLESLGVKIPVITDGQNGCFAKEGNKFMHLGILPIEAVERTGAGDAFGSGCLSAIIKGKPLEEALVWGMVNSSSVISFVGSQRGLLHDSEIPSWIEKVKANNIKVEEI